MIDVDRLEASLAADLSVEEGKRRFAYRDQFGYLTIAVGICIDSRVPGAGLTDDQISYLTKSAIAVRYEEVKNEPWFQACNTEPRQRALLDMYFQLGSRLLGFKESLAAIERHDWEDAATRLRATLWAKQTPKRAKRIIEAIRTGNDFAAS